MKTSLSFSLLLTVLACGPQGKPVDLETEFTLKVGESAGSAAADVSVTFREVLEDSRCPKQVTCVWEGRAEVVLAVVEPEVTRELTFQVKGGEGEQVLRGGLNDFDLFLVKLDPYPETGDTPIPPADYVVTLKLMPKEGDEQASDGEVDEKRSRRP